MGNYAHQGVHTGKTMPRLRDYQKESMHESWNLDNCVGNGNTPREVWLCCCCLRENCECERCSFMLLDNENA